MRSWVYFWPTQAATLQCEDPLHFPEQLNCDDTCAACGGLRTDVRVWCWPGEYQRDTEDVYTVVTSSGSKGV